MHTLHSVGLNYLNSVQNSLTIFCSCKRTLKDWQVGYITFKLLNCGEMNLIFRNNVEFEAEMLKD